MLVQENVHRTLMNMLYIHIYFPEMNSSLPESSKLETSLLGAASTALATITLTPSSPPFMASSLQLTFTLFTLCTSDLSVGLALLLSARFLAHPTLYDEVQARVITEMAHGLFCAVLPTVEYNALTHGVWRTNGCTCRQCAAHVPRILEFALRPDVQDSILERGARRALVGLFGTGWCTPEFAALSPELHVAALKGLAEYITPGNARAILWAAEAARQELAPLVVEWVGTVRLLVNVVRVQVEGFFELHSGYFGRYLRLTSIRLLRILPTDDQELGKLRNQHHSSFVGSASAAQSDQYGDSLCCSAMSV
ncbi:hypothetical protein FB451DRAFT_734372 [Mycena latifolia]|nr:hypothetical protein FB451DRAFT_734372 [Mycena latifolia]